MITCTAIIDRLAAAIAADPALQGWAQAAYGRRCTVITGRDSRLPLAAADYPAVAILPAGYGLGLGKDKLTINLNLQGLIADSATPAATAGGRAAPATERLDELALHLDRILAADSLQTNALYAAGEIDFGSTADDKSLPPTLYLTLLATYEAPRVLGGTVELT